MDLLKIAHRVASEMSQFAAYPDVEVANMDGGETLRSYEIVIKSGKLLGTMRINAESPEDAEEKADEELSGMGWEDAGVKWKGYETAQAQNAMGSQGWYRDIAFLEKNFQANPYDVVSVTDIGEAATHSK